MSKRTRLALGITQDEMGRLMGVHLMTVSKWENGHSHPTPHQEALLRAFHIAGARQPSVGRLAAQQLVGEGVPRAILTLLRAWEPS